MLPRGPWIEFWTCFPEVRGFEFGRASQWSKDLEGIIHIDVCGAFILVPVKYILSISNRVIH